MDLTNMTTAEVEACASWLTRNARNWNWWCRSGARLSGRGGCI